MTKEKISDLRSLHERVVTCTVDNQRTQNALSAAKGQLEDYLWKLEHEKGDSQQKV